MNKKILFSDKFLLTQAVLGGAKTMTRRLVPQSLLDKYDVWYEDFIYKPVGEEKYLSVEEYVLKRTRYKVGEVVAIAQSYNTLNNSGYVAPEWCEHTCESSAGYENKMFVRADLMPHHIKITDVRMERLQKISDDDCMREGIMYYTPANNQCIKGGYGYLTSDGGLHLFGTPRDAYASLVDKISGKGTWDRNPLLVVYSFELEE